LVALDMTSF